MTAQLDLFAQPNPHGVYPEDQAETFTLPLDRKGWRGLPLAQISVLHTPDGWLSASQVQTGSSGYGHGLCSRHGGGFHPTRSKALSRAKRRILAFCIGGDGAEAPSRRKIAAWVKAIQ